MKTIRVLRSTGNHLPRYAEGQVVDVPDHSADLLCELGLAEVIRAIPAEPLQAVPENPSIVAAEQKLRDIKDRWLGDADTSESADKPRPKPRPKQKNKPDTKE